jgi:hypothetical protein
MRTSEKTLFMQTVGKFVVQKIAAMLSPIDERINKLETALAAQIKWADIETLINARIETLAERIEALEMHGIRYVGVYQRAADYKRGDVVTYDGAMWVAIMDAPPNEIPGHSVCWQLSVKGPDPRTRGSDGHDAPRLPTASRPTYETDHRRP